jgi:hypothetical protein
MDQINKVMMLIGTFQKELKELCQWKQAITRDVTNSELTQKQLKIMKIISKSIKAQRNMIASLENLMEDQRKKLASMTKSTGETDDENNDSGSKEDYESESEAVYCDDQVNDYDDLSEDELV